MECSGDYFQLLNTTDVTYYTSASSTTGRLSVCRNNEYVDICADGITNISNIASSLCYYRYYSGYLILRSCYIALHFNNNFTWLLFIL